MNVRGIGRWVWAMVLLGVICLVNVSRAKGADERLLRKEVVVDAPVAVVWWAWTTPEGVSSFWPQQVKIELHPGGAYELMLDREPDREGWSGSQGCKVLSFIPEEMLAFEWSFPVKIESLRYSRAKTQVVLRFEAVGKSKTRIRFVELGWGEGKDWDEGYAYFDEAWDWVLNTFKEKVPQSSRALEARDGSGPGDQVEKVLALLRTLIGGDWIHEGTRPDGGVFRSRSVVKSGPDGKSLVTEGWLGDAEGMYPHGVTQIWQEPVSGEVRFLSINEQGDIARGEVRLAGSDVLVWDWAVVDQTGQEKPFRIDMKLVGKDAYDMKLFAIGESGQAGLMFDIRYERVGEVPARFSRLKAVGRAVAPSHVAVDH